MSALDDVFNDPDHLEWSWWSQRIGEESELMRAFDDWAHESPPPRGPAVGAFRAAVLSAIRRVAAEVAAKYGTP